MIAFRLIARNLRQFPKVRAIHFKTFLSKESNEEEYDLPFGPVGSTIPDSPDFQEFPGLEEMVEYNEADSEGKRKIDQYPPIHSSTPIDSKAFKEECTEILNKISIAAQKLGRANDTGVEVTLKLPYMHIWVEGVGIYVFYMHEEIQVLRYLSPEEHRDEFRLLTDCAIWASNYNNLNLKELLILHFMPLGVLDLYPTI